MSAEPIDWSAWVDASSDDDAPWFLDVPSDEAIWCSGFWAACVALSEHAGVSSDGMREVVVRSIEALTHVHPDASALEAADYAVGAAVAALAELS